jgi:hypothetical protein
MSQLLEYQARLLEYQTRLEDLRAGLSHARSVQTGALLTILAALLLLILFGYWALQHRMPAWCSLLPLAVEVVAVRRWAANRSEWLRLGRLERHYEQGLARIDNRFAGQGFTGEEFQTSEHPYEADLGIFGIGSLFELICTTRTQLGRQRLSEYLLAGASLEEAKARQQAVRELAQRPHLREQIALLGKFDFNESTGPTFSLWLGKPARATGVWVRRLALVCSLGFALLFLDTYVAQPLVMESWLRVAPWLAGLLVVDAAIAVVFHRRAKRALEAVVGVGLEIGVLREGAGLVQRQEFESAKLRAIRENLSLGNAAHLLARLDRLTRALDACRNPFLDIPSRLLILRTQISFAIERWKLQHCESLKGWLAAWAEFEALAALAGYAYEHQNDVYPEFAEGGTVFEARDLGHPLLPLTSCVRNSVALGSERSFYMVGGSNMAGKSTLLRAIGLNTILAYAGAPVRAASMRLSKLSLCASLSIVDSMREGKSKFLAEIGKVRQMMSFARAPTPVLFLIDEVLAGTNSSDRRIAAEAIVRALVGHGAIGALSTHDLALTEIAGMAGLCGTNVHMSARAGADPMDFDYLLKPGVTHDSNALAIARMAGVLT